MTAQLREILLYKGKRVCMATEPLASYLKNRKDVKFRHQSSACWRGYFGTWELRDKNLFIIALKSTLVDRDNVDDWLDLSYLFPCKNEVFADWFSGEIRIPQGKMIQYVHLGYKSIFEKDLILNFKKGVLIDEKVIDNRQIDL